MAPLFNSLFELIRSGNAESLRKILCTLSTEVVSEGSVIVMESLLNRDVSGSCAGDKTGKKIKKKKKTNTCFTNWMICCKSNCCHADYYTGNELLLSRSN